MKAWNEYRTRYKWISALGFYLLKSNEVRLYPGVTQMSEELKIAWKVAHQIH